MNFKNLFRKQVIEPPFDRNHPDLLEATELAFECGGKKFYRFLDDYRMPTGRYKYVYAALKEVDLRMSLELLKEYLGQIKTCLRGEKNQVNLELAWRTIFNMETRLSLAFEPEGVKKLASVVYFTEDEILSTWSKEDGKKKVEFWERHKCNDFFLTRPIGELLGLNASSVTSLETYLSQIYPILEELNSVQPTPSSENS